MRPTQLDVCDPLELEPMFSSFSLRDEPTEIQTSSVQGSEHWSNKQSAVSVENTKSVFSIYCIYCLYLLFQLSTAVTSSYSYATF